MLKSFLVAVIIATPFTAAIATAKAFSFSDSYVRAVAFAQRYEPIDATLVATSVTRDMFAPAPLPSLRIATAIDRKSAPMSAAPTRITIPSIKLDSPIQKVGLNEKKEMDVPSGKTNNVGWYQFGTLPGAVGSAVMDAHVFAAFSRLREVKVGDTIYIRNAAGSTLRFVVAETKVYALADVPRELLFNRADSARLNLITCAGRRTKDGSTYDHRLIVYAQLADDVRS